MPLRSHAAPLVVIVSFAVGCGAGQSEAPGRGSPDGGGGGGDGGEVLDGGPLLDGSDDGGHSAAPIPETCAESIAQQSYIGCEYWPTVTANMVISNPAHPFHYAIAVANPTHSDATVTVDQAGQPKAQETVPAGGLKTIPLDWVPALKEPPFNASGLVPGAAYHVTSSVPVTVYQFNALEFQSVPGCTGDQFSGCYSYSNDASLLMPTTALRKEYLLSGYQTLHTGSVDTSGNGNITWADMPGFVAIVATQNDTVVQLASTAHTSGGTNIAPLAPGGAGQWQLNAGDVLQIMTGYVSPADPLIVPPGCTTASPPDGTMYFCPIPGYDLTGSTVTASAPVEVITGHDCAFVPFDAYACDHLEESMFPLETLGTDVLVTAPQSARQLGTPGVPDNHYLRVLSGGDGNAIAFDPPTVHAPVTLNKGEWIDVQPFTGDVRITGNDRLLVTQFLVGQNFFDHSLGDNHLSGDPAMTVAIPIDQYRDSYEFLAPESYVSSFVNVAAPIGVTVTLDGAPMPDTAFTPIGSSGWQVARQPIQAGAHEIHAGAQLGIVVYGYGPYTSYLYPGGLNFGTIDIPVH